MSCCWSCQIIVEQGVAICPLCGADQKNPVKIVDLDLPPPPTLASFLHDWLIVIVAIVVVAGAMAGILWHNFGTQSVSPSSQAAEIAAKSLRDLREALSAYALSTKDVYPATLDLLGDQKSLPIEAALSAGYKLQYVVNPSSREEAPRSFVILARPEKSNYLNLCIDESGVVRATQEDRPATVRDPPL